MKNNKKKIIKSASKSVKIGHDLYKSQCSLAIQDKGANKIIAVEKIKHDGTKTVDSFVVTPALIKKVKSFKGGKRAYHKFCSEIGLYTSLRITSKDKTNGLCKDTAKGEWSGNELAELAGRDDLKYGAKYGFYQDK